MKKDQIQQISEQIQKRTINIGRVKPKYTKFIMPAGRVVPGDQQNNLDIRWSKWWFVPTDLFTGSHIGPQTFSAWVDENPDMHYGSIENVQGNIYDGPVAYNAHIYYAIEVKSDVPQTLTIKIDTACRINILVDNRSEISGSKSSGHIHTTVLPAGEWIPIEVYVHNPYAANDLLNKISIEMNLRNTVEAVRSQIPMPPSNFIASYGDYTDHIELSWDLNTNISDLDKIQIWRCPEISGTYEPIGSIDANLASFTDSNVYQSESYYYKARFITAEGGLSAFSTIVNGLVGEIGGIISAEFSRNTAIGDQYTIGNYQSNEEITITLRSSTTVFEDGVIVELEYPTTHEAGYYKVPVGTDGLATYSGTNEWTVNIDLSTVAEEGYPLAEGRAKLIVKAYLPGIAPDGWMGPQGTAGMIVVAHGFNIDDESPSLSFFIDYDRQFDNEDTFTYSNNVALLIRDITDPNTNSRPYHNPEGDEYEENYVDGIRYVSEVYQIRYGNDSETLTGLNGEMPLTPWINYSMVGNIIDPHYLDMINQDDVKSVYIQIRDKAGNESSVFSDDITYLDSLEQVPYIQVVDHYEYIKISWNQIAGSVDGYYLYRNTTGTTPDDGATPHAIIGPAYGYELITEYTDRYASTQPDITYYYWAKAYLGDGTNPEDHIISQEYSDRVSTDLRKDPPSADTVEASAGTQAAVYVQFGVPIGDDAEQAATEHLIYRSANIGAPTIANSELIQTIGFVQNGETFDFYDSSVLIGNQYKYASVARNGPWLDDSVYYTQTDTINWTDVLELVDDPPNAPEWALGQTSAGPWGVNLVWINNKYTYPEDADVIGYTLFMSSGTLGNFSTSEPVAHVACPDADEQFVHHIMFRDSLPAPVNEFWLVAYDINQSGELSEMLATGYVALFPNTPEWVSGECFAEFGWNQLTWLGGGDDYGYQYGFNIYRAMFEVGNEPTSDTLLYATGTYGASLVNVFIDQRDDPNWKNVLVDTIEESGWGMEYCYWITAFNNYGYESDAVLLTGLGMTRPNYESLFINSLDNGSFERDFQIGTWEILEHNSCFLVTTGQHSCRPGYSGYECTHGPWGNTTVHFVSSNIPLDNYSQLKYQYVFVQPNTDYCLSYYMYRTDTWVYSDSFGIVVEWYTVSGDLISFIEKTYGNGDIAEKTWTRKHFFDTAPSNASYATIRFGFKDVSQYDYCHIDAVQWETSGNDAPGRFIDSRNISADKILAHSIVADMIQAGSINAEHIQAEQISSYHIKVHSIDLDRLTTIPGIPSTRFVIDPIYSGNDYHDLQLDTSVEGVRQISPDNTTWYDCEWNTTELPVLWGNTGSYTLNGPNNDDTYYIYITGWPADGEIAYIKLSEANTYPSDVGTIIGRAENTLEGGEEGFPGFFSVMEWNGPGVTINGNQITAGSINGLLIQSETISGRQILALSISGDHIVSNTLETRHLQAYSITAEKVLVSASESNLLTNPHWETMDTFGQDLDSTYNWHNPYSATYPKWSYDIDRWMIVSGYDNGAYLWKPDIVNVPGDGNGMGLRYTTLSNNTNMRNHGIHYRDSTNRDQLYLNPSKTYTFSMMCKLHSSNAGYGKPKFAIYSPVDSTWYDSSAHWHVASHNGSYSGVAPCIKDFDDPVYMDENGWVTLYIAFGKDDGLSMFTPTNWDDGNFEKCYIALNVSNLDMDMDMTFANFCVTEGRRIPIPYQRRDFASTQIDGTQISTGKIRTRLVTIEDDTGKTTMDGAGIKVESVEGNQYTRLNERTLRYFDNGYVTKYGQRQEFQHIVDELSGSLSIGRLFYYKELRQHPQIICTDNGYLTNSAAVFSPLVADIASRPVWIMPMMYQAAYPGGAVEYKINTLQGTLLGKFFYGGPIGNSNYYKVTHHINELDFYSYSSLNSYPYCGYVQTGSHDPGQYDSVSANYIYSSTFDDWITWNRAWPSADTITGMKLTTNFTVTIHGPCTGWKFYWSQSLIAQHDTQSASYGLDDYEIRETRSGWDTITLDDDDVYTLLLPQQVFNLLTWEASSWYVARDSYALQFRVWTEDTSQSVKASGSVFDRSTTNPYIWGKPVLMIERMKNSNTSDHVDVAEESANWSTDVIINEV